MWILHLTNFGQRWHFNTYAEAEAYGKYTGFEYTIEHSEKLINLWRS